MGKKNKVMETSLSHSPEGIKISGLSFFYQGWNNTYKKQSYKYNGKPVYKLDAYNLYGLFPVYEAEISYTGYEWIFTSSGCKNII